MAATNSMFGHIFAYRNGRDMMLVSKPMLLGMRNKLVHIKNCLVVSAILFFKMAASFSEKPHNLATGKARNMILVSKCRF